MTKNIDEKIAETLGIDFTESTEVVEYDQDGVIAVLEDNNTLPAPLTEDQQQFKQDFDLARENLLEIQTVALIAVKEFAKIAKQDQAARSYEVLGQLLEKTSALQSDMLELHAKKRSLEPVEEPIQNNNNININNAIITTTADLLSQAKAKKKAESE